MTWKCRCTKCRMRVTHHKHPHNYVNDKVCEYCGSPLIVDQHRQSGKEDRHVCTCDGIMYPHREGSKWCNSYTGIYSDDDLRGRNLC